MSLPDSSSAQNSLSGPEERWLETTDGVSLFYRLWQGGPGPAVIYVHGIEGHGQWIEETAAGLVNAGVSVYAADRRGAGRNQMSGIYGIRARRLIDDLAEMYLSVRKERPDSPVFFMANCWGAKPLISLLTSRARRYPRVEQEDLSGVILTSPALKVQVDVDFATKMKIALAWMTGSTEEFPIPLTPEMFTENPEYLEFIRLDPLRTTHASGQFFAAGVYMSYLACAGASSITAPLLVLQSGQDKIVDADYVATWFERAGSRDKVLKCFEESSHSLDFDRARHRYVDVLIDWINKRLGGYAHAD